MRQWLKDYWEFLLILAIGIPIIICAVIYEIRTPDYTVTIYKTFTTNNITFVDINRVPAYEVQLDKDDYFTWDGWTIEVK